MNELAKNSSIKRQYQNILLHHRELPEEDKERAFSALHSDTGTTLVIATSGITTGTNPQALFRTVVWKDIWSIENAIQCIGRTARKAGQVGSAKLMTWHNAVQACAGSEFARLASTPATFFDEAVRIIDCDRGSNRNARASSEPVIVVNQLDAVRQLLKRPGTWKLNELAYMQCHICGANHMARDCKFKGQDDAPRSFCWKCLLPLWPIDGVECT
jgi:hypothetical protein